MRPAPTQNLRRSSAAAIALASLLAFSQSARPDPGTDARAIMLEQNRASYYAGRDMRSKILMKLGDGRPSVRNRVMTLLRWTEAPDGDQKYLVYFHEPGDVRRMSCMVWKRVGLPDERWMFVPISGRIVRVLSPDRSSFLGSEFVREELAGRDVDADTHRLLRMEPIDGRSCFVVESRPRIVEDFTSYVSWIDRKTHLSLRQEFRDGRGEVARVLTAKRLVEIRSATRPGVFYPVLLERTMTSLPSGRWTTVELDSLSFDIGLREADFSPQHLRTPLRDWLP